MVNSINDPRDFCKEHLDDLLKVNRDCRKCSLYRKCSKVFKDDQILSFLKMDRAESRFPGWFFDLFHRHTWFIHSLPEAIFTTVYGNSDKQFELHNKNWGCIFYAKDIVKNLDYIEKVYEMLTDNLSKQTYLNVLMYRLTADKTYILQAYMDIPQYFTSPFCGSNRNAVYIDGGAYTGDTF